MTRSSLHTISFRRIHLSQLFLDTDELKLDLRARKVSEDFEERVLGLKMT